MEGIKDKNYLLFKTTLLLTICILPKIKRKSSRKLSISSPPVFLKIKPGKESTPNFKK